MKIIYLEAFNFASYESLKFSPSEAGLALVYGPTGSGKSTLLDAACWGLFGVTSKNGSVDEVRSWQCSLPTKVNVLVELTTGVRLSVVRYRGTAKENDLYFNQIGENVKTTRGKDIKDTQRLLEQRLGVSADLYLSAAYASEFNPTATFFVANAKTRRQVFEQIASLEMATKLTKSASDRISSLKKLLTPKVNKIMRLETQESTLLGQLKDAIKRRNTWEKTHQNEECERLAKYSAWNKCHQDERDRLTKEQYDWLKGHEVETKRVGNKLANLTKEGRSCSKCGARNDEIIDLERQWDRLADRINPFDRQIERHDSQINPYTHPSHSGDNPHKTQVSDLDLSIVKIRAELSEERLEEEALNVEMARLSILSELTDDLRAALLQNSVQCVQNDTNDYLERFFDSEFRVSLILDGADALEVEIMKNANPCVYRQLSKGQRQILKLCFTVAVMKASANRAGIHFDNLYFDEPTDGCDAEFKVKSYRLFEELALSHSSVLVVDHSTEFKELFTNKFKVSLKNDVSEIEADNE